MSEVTYYREEYRPQFHFTAKANWLNDPNGCVFHDGKYHLFFQHNPTSCEHGNMMWGHAVSTDLVHWRQLENALLPYDYGTIYSGSAVVDANNTSNLGAEDRPPLVSARRHSGSRTESEDNRKILPAAGVSSIMKRFFRPGYFSGAAVKTEYRSNMKRIIILSIMLASLLGSNVHAKRLVPTTVKPVKSGQIEYRAPRNQMGCIEAWDTARKKLIWRRQIYVVQYDLKLERDVQDVFVTTMELKGNTLVVSNERKSEYQLDIKSLEVKVIKGSLIEHHQPVPTK